MIPGSVLLLDGHTNQALACIRSLGRTGYRVLVASDRRWPLGGWSTYCQARYRLPEQSPEAVSELRKWAREQGVNCVLPLTERACLLCNAERSSWEEAGITVGCGPEPMLIRAFDKAQTFRYADGCGVTIPQTHFPESMEDCEKAATELGYPCIVKPRFSNLWDGTRFLPDRGTAYVGSAAELQRAVLERTQGNVWPLIQAYAAGRGKGVFALCDHGQPVAWFAHERLRDVRPSGSGSSLRRSVALEPRLRAPAERLLSALEWHGPAMVEFRDDGLGEPVLMEVNGRFWGSLQLAIEAGVDFPALWLRILGGEQVQVPCEYRDGVVVRWLWGDFKRFLYILRGPPTGYPGAFPTWREGLGELFGPQPPGTRMEAWDVNDRWPAVGEWVGGIDELVFRR